MPIFFYLPAEPNGWLSNFSPHGVELNAKWWPTVEHYFQAAKFFTSDASYAEKIRLVRKPRDAKRLGNDRSRPLRKDWEQVKDEIMLQAVRQKFVTHAKLRERLLNTGDTKLVERAPHDRYWGSGQDGTGLNKLGVILMQVRSDLSIAPQPEDTPPPPNKPPRGPRA